MGALLLAATANRTKQGLPIDTVATAVVTTITSRTALELFLTGHKDALDNIYSGFFILPDMLPMLIACMEDVTGSVSEACRKYVHSIADALMEKCPPKTLVNNAKLLTDRTLQTTLWGHMDAIALVRHTRAI